MDSGTTIAWSGESDSRNPGEFLNPLMARLAKQCANQSVTVEFSELKYMNSATVAPLISCIKAFDAVATSVLVTFSDVDWQRTHVQCVRTISRTLKHVTVEVKRAATVSGRPA
jgi:anti-anti-sigma regulatory factor